MTKTLEHRGPDGEGFFEQPGIAFGHRRLSIIDLVGGAQPMANEDQTIWVILNGEIYNFQTLREQLEKSGHSFRSRSDTEVLVHLYEDFGTDMLQHLRGMYAFALWDVHRRTLLLARDRLGKKPLVYWHNAQGIRFASELKALLVDPAFPREIDESALDEYLAYQYVPHPRTIYRAARKLPPGHYAQYRDGRLEIHRYWRPDYTREIPRRAPDYVEALKSTLAEATRIRMISDVPLGAFLSGGIDSTIVVGLMRRLSNGPVKTFSIGFSVADYDERGYAREAARHLGTDHEEFVVEPNALDVIGRLAWHYDEPFADSSAVPTYYVSQLTRQRVTVALSGDGGDELFGGYPRYQAVRMGTWFDRLPTPLRRLIACRCWQRLPTPARQKSTLRRAKKLLAHIERSPEDRYRQFVTIFDDATRAAIYSQDFAGRLDRQATADWIYQCYRELPNRDFLTRTMYVDLVSYLPCDLLVKVDIASMANGLECRGPFLDHEVVALAGAMPASMKIRGRRTKVVLKQAFAEFLPGRLRNRRKMGFGVPIDQWLRRELADVVRDLLLDVRARKRGWFETSTVNRLIEEHLVGAWDHSYRLWALMMLELWARTFMDRAGSPRPADALPAGA
jgi:asparagine synthase (glutamine-hydrolysing)